MIERALIFAAGRGERMRPLSDATPKPLLHAGRRRLIERHLDALARAGVREIVINTSHLAAQFAPALAAPSWPALRIVYSYEGSEALDSGGGMLRALPLLGPEPFLAVNGDVFCDLDFSALPQAPAGLAHLLLVDNPPQHAGGDFALRNGRVDDDGDPRLTFAGIGVYRPELLAGQLPGRFSLVPLLRAAMRAGRVGGEHFRGAWCDVGTPQRLAALDGLLQR